LHNSRSAATRTNDGRSLPYEIDDFFESERGIDHSSFEQLETLPVRKVSLHWITRGDDAESACRSVVISGFHSPSAFYPSN
jgi:hypothetical protein